MNIQATHKNARMSPRKMRPLARILKGVPVAQAKVQLQFFPGKAAVLIHDVLKSAVANAVHNYRLDEKNLIVREVRISPGFVMKRFMPVSKGMAHAILKRTAHVTVLVTEGQPSAKPLKARKAEIETISAQEYAERGGEAPEEETNDAKDPKKAVAGKGKTAPREADASADKQTFEAFQKTKMNQQGGDPKKTHRRQGKKASSGK